jgi:phosphoribosylamine--glycine ligase
MNVLIIGSGGRENALAWAVKRSPKVMKIYIAPGNGGTARMGENVSLPVKPPFGELVQFAKEKKIDLTIVGPEQPLVDGIVDVFRRYQLPVFGPSKSAARLEGSKAFMKEFLKRNNIPTARFRVFDDADEAYRYVQQENRPFVVKTDGLAAGKGVTVAKTVEETLTAIRRVMVQKEFGNAGDRIVVEDLLSGTEVSVFVVTDGTDWRYIASAQDHKRVFDNDEGPNTGGMGAFAPAPFVDDKTKKVIQTNIIQPTIDGMRREGNPYTGILYFGLMLTSSGPSVIEYNVRWGDPEAEVVLPLLKTDLTDVAFAVLENRLGSLSFDLYGGYCCGVVLASGGYPASFRKGYIVNAPDPCRDDVMFFHAGTKVAGQNTVVTDGGRVLCVSALGDTLQDAVDLAYEYAEKVKFENMHYRKDIGQKGLDYFLKK